MRTIIVSLVLCMMTIPCYCQIVRFEPTKIDSQKALKLVTVKNHKYIVAAGQIGTEDALVLVTGHRHGLDTCSGGFAITKTRVIYSSLARPDHNFNLVRAELLTFEVNDWKSLGKVVYMQMAIKTKGKDYNFFPWAESVVYGNNLDDFPPVLGWFGVAISNFDEAWKKFQETYEANTPKDTLISPEGRAITILERYDKFKDRTTFATSHMYLKGTHASITFQAAFVSDGASASKPQVATLYIDADDTVRRLFKGDRSLIFLMDGERLKLGEMSWLDSTYIPGGRYYSGSVIDELGIVIPWETLAKIANGSNVEFQVGTVEAKLEPIHLEALKKLIAKTEK